MDRQYTAYCDNGHEYFDFEFYSEHRANSKANIEDAKRHYKRKHGNGYIKVIRTAYNKEPIL